MASRKPDSGSTVGTGLRVLGNITSREALRVEGILEGNLVVEGPVEVSGPGRVKGDISASDVVVEGRVDGNVTVADRLELRVTARVRGDLNAPRVAMAEGSFFRGRLTTASQTRQSGS